MKYISTMVVGAMFLLPRRFAYGVEVMNQIKARFMKPVELPPDHKRTVAELPAEGPEIPVETALNSRCTSDYNNAQEIFHWGMFDTNKKLSTSQIDEIFKNIKIPRLTKHRAEVRVNGNEFTFVVDRSVWGTQRDWLMIESGMQQQAVCLICAGLGVGMVFKSYGEDGKILSEIDYATMRIRLDAMKPSYEGFYWTTMYPDGIRPWLKGNLPIPVRTGTQPLIKTLSSLKPQNNGSKQVSENLASQLLWAARGRTPHLYQSKAWGMTIPTPRGAQNNTHVHILDKESLSRYVNWAHMRPTHSLKKIQAIGGTLSSIIIEALPYDTCCIILSGDNRSDRVCWEIGYQLLNLMLQAKALELKYTTVLLDDEQKGIVSEVGVEHPVAAICF